MSKGLKDCSAKQNRGLDFKKTFKNTTYLIPVTIGFPPYPGSLDGPEKTRKY